MSRSARRAPIATALLCALLTACGSTVPVGSGQATLQQGGGDGLAAPTGAVAADGTPLAPGEVGAGTVSSGGSLGTGPGAAAAGGGGPGAVAGSIGGGAGAAVTGVRGAESGRGFTRTTIRLGVATANDSNAFAGSFGLSGYSGDPNRWFEAVIGDINSRGGLLGRKIELVKHDYNTAELLNDTARANQRACTTWTQDKPVFAVLLAGFIVEDTLLGCLAKAETPLVYPGASLDYPLHYAQTYAKYPLFFNLAQMVGDRYDRLAIGRLAARGFFTPWDTAQGRPGTAAANPVKVGILGFDDPDGVIQEASRKRELARYGYSVGPQNSIRCPRALTAKIQCMQSAVLRMASSGVTHIIGTDLIFMQNAQSQGYRPRYFIAVQASLYAAQQSASQLNGAMGQGYVPIYDVAPQDSPGDPSPATATCRELMKAAGQAATDGNTLALQYAVCEEFNFLEAALDKAGALSATALRAGMEGLGSSQPSTLTFRTFLSPKEHTSAAVLRDLEYRSDLGRFVYTSTADHGDAG